MNLVEAAHERIENARAELQSAKAFLKHVDIPPMRAEAKTVMAFVTEQYGIDASELVGPSHAARSATPRYVAMYLMRAIHGIPANDIGRYFNRTSGAVDHALQTLQDRRDTEKKFRFELSALVTAYTPLPATSTPHTDHVSESTTDPAGGITPANARIHHA